MLTKANEDWGSTKQMWHIRLQWSSLSPVGMPSYCCSFSDFLQSHHTVLLSSFLLPLVCTSWCWFPHPCISQIFQVWICSFSFVFFCRTDQECLQWPFFFLFWGCMSRISLAVSVTAVLKVVITESRSVSSLFIMVRGASFWQIIAWKVSNILESFDFSRSNLSLVCFGILLLCRRRWKIIINKSRSLYVFQKHTLVNVFCQCSLLIGSASSLECNQSGCDVVHLGYAMSMDALWWPEVLANIRSLKVANSRSLIPLLFVPSLQKGPQMPCQFPQASLTTFAFQSPCATRMSFFGVWSRTFCSWSQNFSISLSS